MHWPQPTHLQDKQPSRKIIWVKIPAKPWAITRSRAYAQTKTPPHAPTGARAARAGQVWKAPEHLRVTKPSCAIGGGVSRSKSRGRDSIQHPKPLARSSHSSSLHREKHYTSQLSRITEEGQWAFHSGDFWLSWLKKWLMNIERKVAEEKEKVFLSFCRLFLIQISMKLVKWTFFCQQCLAREVGTCWAPARFWQLLLTPNLVPSVPPSTGVSSVQPPDHLQEPRRDSVEVHQLKHTKLVFLLIYLFGLNCFTKKTMSRFTSSHTVPGSSLNPPSTLVPFSQVLCLPPLKSSRLEIFKYQESDPSCVCAPLQSIITLAHLCDRNNGFCLPKMQSLVARQLHPEAPTQRGAAVWEDRARLQELLLLLRVAIIGGKLGIHCFHQRAGRTQPWQAQKLSISWLQTVAGARLFCSDVTEKLWQRCRSGWLLSEGLRSLQGEGKRGHPFQIHSENRLHMPWGLILLRDQALSTLHRLGLQQLSCSGIIRVPFQPQPGSLSTVWIETCFSLDNQALIYEILLCSSQR